jgi:hypothetical protein
LGSRRKKQVFHIRRKELPCPDKGIFIYMILVSPLKQDDKAILSRTCGQIAVAKKLYHCMYFLGIGVLA